VATWLVQRLRRQPDLYELVGLREFPLPLSSRGRNNNEQARALGPISPTFYAQLLHVQIPKSAKKTDSLTVFFALLGAACVKTARPMLVKSNHGIEMGILLLMKERRDLIDLIRSLLHKLQNIFSAPVKLSGLWKKSIKNMSVLL